jgi:similar to stage IV sporulation protein
LVVAILIFGLTRFVWNIEINCDEEIDKAKIIELLEENGIKEGALISKLNTDKAINTICLEREDISWVGIKISGTNVIVSIEMATEKPDIIDENEVCDIVADKDAVITKITVLNGTAVVSEGDTVKKGDVLVKGIIQGKYTDEREVHSEALIYAKTWYTKVDEQSLKQSYYEQTENTYNNFGIKFNNFKINFNKRLPKFEKYDTIITDNKLKIFSNFYFPIEFEKISYTEKVLKYKEYTAEELSEELQQKLKNEVLEENNILEDDLLDCIVSVNTTDESVRVKLTCIVEEQIGKSNSN